MKIVFLPTIQHTGTRFLHFTIAYAVKPHYCKLQLGFDNPNMINPYCYALDNFEGEAKRTRIGSFEKLIVCIKQRLAIAEKSSRKTPFVGEVITHFGSGVGSFIPFEIQERMMDIFPTAITVRDPLAALITREGRTSADEHKYIVNGFAELAASQKDFFCLPVDLYGEKAIVERLRILRELLEYLGVPADKSYIMQAATDWTNYGATQKDLSLSIRIRKYADQLKKAYRYGEVEKIIEAMPRTYEYLKSKELIIRPFLEKLGYRDLLWWGK